MNSHNPKSNTVAKPAPMRIASDRNEVRVLRSTLQEAERLEISDDQDSGGDPYNSTGQHIVMKIKQESPE
ncbi:MAG TPA: hypothetical protein PKH39_13895 [Woeseiaceae bacterium]|nr:hypothetical protein [Woeseiaceae bacterium]